VDVQELEVSVTTAGDVAEAAKQYAAEKVTQLARYTKRPILFAQVRLTLEANPSRERPALAEATLDVNGRPVRAHVAGHDMMEAVDLLEERLRRRLERQAHHGDGERRRSPIPQPGEWRHGDLPTQRPEYFDRPVEEREVVRHKTFALEPMSCDEAAFDLEMLGHDFYLFTELHSGADSVIYHADDGHLELQQATDEPAVSEGTATPIALNRQHPPVLTLAEAEERLDTGHERFVFFVNAETGRGNVIYRRYDGHYGLITPA